jgi:hypothetical protein
MVERDGTPQRCRLFFHWELLDAEPWGQAGQGITNTLLRTKSHEKPHCREFALSGVDNLLGTYHLPPPQTVITGGDHCGEDGT